MIINSLDNSEWMRNGDYSPSRLEAQADAAQLLANVKLQDNVENAVSIITMGGDSPKVMVTLTSEQGKLLHAINSIDYVGSSSNILSAIQIAQLVLKHRQNANQKQRIVVFVGSPLKADMAAVERINLLLRKNNISIDAVSFGNVDANEQILAGLLQTDEDADEDDRVNHFVRVVPGQGSIVQAISQTTMVRRGDGEGMAGDFEFGVDPEMDPELAMALRLSMQEEEERQARVAKQQQSEDVTKKEMDIDQQEPFEEEEDEDALLQQAIALSMETAKKESKE